MNDCTVDTDLRVTVPTNIIPYAKEGISGTAGTLNAFVEAVPPGGERSLFMDFKCQRVGEYLIKFGGTYWPTGNKDLFQPITLQQTLRCVEPSEKLTFEEAETEAAPAPVPTPAPEPTSVAPPAPPAPTAAPPVEVAKTAPAETVEQTEGTLLSEVIDEGDGGVAFGLIAILGLVGVVVIGIIALVAIAASRRGGTTVIRE